MFTEKLITANKLNVEIERLQRNKGSLSLGVSDVFQPRKIYLKVGVDGLENIHIVIPAENFKIVMKILNTINEEQLTKTQKDFENCFNAE